MISFRKITTVKRERHWAALGCVPFLALSTCLFIDGTAWAGSLSEKKPPVVMLLLDTSGSMQYVVSADVCPTSSTTGPWCGQEPLESATCNACPSEGAIPNCNVAGKPAKTRWIQTREILSGTFNDYTCSLDDRSSPPGREDRGYEIPNVVYSLSGSPAQYNDGLLDINGGQIKFGLATFDAEKIPGQGQGGGWSYGKAQDGGSVNLGIRNTKPAAPGHLILPTTSDLESDMRAKASEIENSLANLAPWGGTPISPMLSDIDFLFKTEPSLGPYNEGSNIGDPYEGCREKYAILITDGKPTLGEEEMGYGASIDAARTLFENGVTLYVVGFNVTAEAISTLHDIAMAGSGGQEAFLVSTQEQLAIALSAILTDILDSTITRSPLVFTDKTRNSLDPLYHFHAGFKSDTNNSLNRAGILEQSIYRCQSDCQVLTPDAVAGVCEVLSLGDLMADASYSRKIYTAIEGQSGIQNFHPDNTAITTKQLNLPTDGLLQDLSLTAFPNGVRVCGTRYLSGSASNPSTLETYRRQLISHIRADAGSCREETPLGAIYHGTPVVQNNLSGIRLRDLSFDGYQLKIKERPTTLFTGTHEGMIHGFRVDRLPSELDEYGTELFGYVPNFVLSKLKTLADRIDFLLDGVPVLKETLLSRTRSQLQGDGTDLVSRWRSVLIVPGGARTAGVAALDVTDPTEPSVLWEISPEKGLCLFPNTGGPFACGTLNNQFTRLGYYRGKVAVGTIFYNPPAGVKEERAIAIIPAGEASESGPADSGKSVYVVNLETGEKIAEFNNSAGNVVDHSSAPGNITGLDFDMVGTPACYNAYAGQIMTRCIIGDAGGQLWYLRFSSSDPDTWVLEYFHDAYASPIETNTLSVDAPQRRPVWEAPTVALHKDQSGRLVVAYHTSRVEDTGEPGLLPARLISLVESMELGGTGTLKVTGKINWFKLFEGEGESGTTLTGSPLVFDQTVFQAAFLPTDGDLCGNGTGQLWGIDYVGNGANDSKTDDIIGRINSTDTSELYVEIGAGLTLGVQTLNRPTCNGEVPVGTGTGEGGSGNSSLSNITPTSLELLVARTGSGIKTSEDQVPPDGAAATIHHTSHQTQSSFTKVFMNAWGNLLE